MTPEERLKINTRLALFEGLTLATEGLKAHSSCKHAAKQSFEEPVSRPFRTDKSKNFIAELPDYTNDPAAMERIQVLIKQRGLASAYVKVVYKLCGLANMSREDREIFLLVGVSAEMKAKAAYKVLEGVYE